MNPGPVSVLRLSLHYRPVINQETEVRTEAGDIRQAQSTFSSGLTFHTNSLTRCLRVIVQWPFSKTETLEFCMRQPEAKRGTLKGLRENSCSLWFLPGKSLVCRTCSKQGTGLQVCRGKLWEN